MGRSRQLTLAVFFALALAAAALATGVLTRGWGGPAGERGGEALPQHAPSDGKLPGTLRVPLKAGLEQQTTASAGDRGDGSDEVQVVAAPATRAAVEGGLLDRPPASATVSGPAVSERSPTQELLSPLDPASWVRVPKPTTPSGPRRIGLQAGHWLTELVPEELQRLEHATGASGGGVPEWRLNLDIANRAAAILRRHGYQVDVLPTAIPSGYLADVFISLHADGDANGIARGYKAAHGSRRGPYEDQLVRVIMEEYGRATGLPVDPMVSRNMLGYYAFSWSRFSSTAAPHTPAAILEMGFLTSAADRALLLAQPDVVATGVVNGVLRFLNEVPAGAAFANDLLVPPRRPFPPFGGLAPPAPASPEPRPGA